MCVCVSEAKPTVTASCGRDAATLQNPCPICLDAEDDADDETGDVGMCYNCGQMYCGSCKEGLESRDVAECPTCRTDLYDISDAESARQLQRLVARPHGRHTVMAQFNLGLTYAHGLGVVRSDVEAAKFFRLAADQGYPKAQNSLSSCYANGAGVTKNVNEAVRWARRAAEQGEVVAQSNLAAAYSTGMGIPQDLPESVRWYERAAAQGDATAQFDLAVCYMYGRGVNPSKVEASRWAGLAAAQGHTDAIEALANLRYM